MVLQSLTYKGVVIILLSGLLKITGVPFAEGQVEQFVETGVLLIGAAITLYGRYRAGGLNIFGGRVEKA